MSGLSVRGGNTISYALCFHYCLLDNVKLGV